MIVNNLPQNKFWYVFCPEGSLSSAKHPTKESALDEAKRLSGCFPGSLFFVLELVHAVVKSNVVVADYE